jgi:hypothetical protein
MTKPAMTEAELAALCAAHEAAAVGYFDGEIAGQQARAIDYYYGVMADLPALDGCSSVVDHKVAVTVDNGLAAILKPFVSADELVRFAPRGPEDERQAEQATEYVNYVINCDNPGFLILHDWFKDALLTKLGVVKVWWEDLSETRVEEIPADAAGLLALREDEAYLDEREIGDGLYAVRMERIEPDGRVRVEGVPPEEFLVSPFARSGERAPYQAHRPGHFTRSDLVEMGVDPKIAEGLPAASTGSVQAMDEARSQARYRDENWASGAGELGGAADRSRDRLAILDEYVRADFDGDGIAELRRVVRVGDTILLNEATEEAPFATLCPVPMPHKVYGLATADLAIEGQKVSTAVLRQTLDNLYKSNNPRPVVPDGAVNDSTWDDLADTAPGAAIRVKAAGQLDTFDVPFVAQHSFPMLEYIAQGIEERTGILRHGNGMNPEVLRRNSPNTATQAAIESNARSERAEMIARIFAETGVKRLFRLILKLLVAHQPAARLIRLRNEWVAVDPRGWNADMDLNISVGLGVGNKAEQIGQADSVLATMAQLQATPFGWLVDAGKVHNALKRKLNAAGIRNVGDFLLDPARVQPPAPPPSPEMAKARQAADEARFRQDLARAEAAAAMRLAQQKAEFEARLALAKAGQEFELEKIRLGLARGVEQGGEVAMPRNRDGGDLSE